MISRNLASKSPHLSGTEITLEKSDIGLQKKRKFPSSEWQISTSLLTPESTTGNTC